MPTVVVAPDFARTKLGQGPVLAAVRPADDARAALRFARELGATPMDRPEDVEPNPVMLPFNVMADLSRTLALAVRLFGNVMSGTKIVIILLAVGAAGGYLAASVGPGVARWIVIGVAVVLALFLGVVFLGDRLTPVQILGSLLTLGGVAAPVVAQARARAGVWRKHPRTRRAVSSRPLAGGGRGGGRGFCAV